MERRIEKKCDNFMHQFKSDLNTWITNNSNKITNIDEHNVTADFLQFMYDYDKITFQKEDFQKRKRAKNIVAIFERCHAKRANGEQCTRRKKENYSFCGTHIKGIPHGITNIKNDAPQTCTKIEVWIQEIKGINYYIDNFNNVYKAEDICSNQKNPNIIAKYEVHNGNYSIPELNI